MERWFDSPFIVPIAGCIMILGIVIARVYGDVAAKQVRSQERLALLQRGVSLADVERMLPSSRLSEAGGLRDPMRSLGTARRVAIVLVSSGVGIVIFGLLLWLILQVRPVLVVAALGAINLLIGAGFAVDYRMQQREIARFYPEATADL